MLSPVAPLCLAILLLGFQSSGPSDEAPEVVLPPRIVEALGTAFREIPAGQQTPGLLVTATTSMVEAGGCEAAVDLIVQQQPSRDTLALIMRRLWMPRDPCARRVAALLATPVTQSSSSSEYDIILQWQVGAHLRASGREQEGSKLIAAAAQSAERLGPNVMWEGRAAEIRAYYGTPLRERKAAELARLVAADPEAVPSKFKLPLLVLLAHFNRRDLAEPILAREQHESWEGLREIAQHDAIDRWCEPSWSGLPDWVTVRRQVDEALTDPDPVARVAKLNRAARSAQIAKRCASSRDTF